MSPSIPSPRRLEQLFQNMEDGCITGAEHAELMEVLRKEAGIRDSYLRHMEFAGLLHAKAEALAELDRVHPEREEPRPSRLFLRSTLAAAAVIALAAYLATLFILPDPPAASVTVGPNTHWSYEHGGLDKEQGFLPGTVMSVEAGTLDVQLGSGSQMVVEGPARVLIKGPEEVHLPYGRLWVRAAGDRFTVHTKRLKIVDLGTEFGVTSSSNLDEEVHVAKGRVRVVPILNTLPAVELAAGRAVRANIVGKLRSAPFDAGSFQTELPEQAPYLHWSFDEVVNGGFPSTGIGLAPAPIAVYALHDHNTALELSPAGGRFGGALALDRPDCFAQADFPGIAGNLPRTVAFWVRGVGGSANATYPLVCWGLATEFGTKWVLAVKPDGRQISTGWGGAWAQTMIDPEARPVLDGNWHHLAYVFTGRTDAAGRPELVHYLDGEALPHRKPAPIHPVNTDSAARNSWPLTIGTQLFTDPQRPTFTGSMDELYVFRAALGSGQIRMLYERNQFDAATTPTPSDPGPKNGQKSKE